jgi:hypothetical protein
MSVKQIVKSQFNTLIYNRIGESTLYKLMDKDNTVEVYKSEKLLFTINLGGFTYYQVQMNSDSWRNYKTNLLNKFVPGPLSAINSSTSKTYKPVNYRTNQRSTRTVAKAGCNCSKGR